MAEQLAERLAEQDSSKASKVLIFTAPIVCVDCIKKTTSVKNKGKLHVVSSMALMSGNERTNDHVAVVRNRLSWSFRDKEQIRK